MSYGLLERRTEGLYVLWRGLHEDLHILPQGMFPSRGGKLRVTGPIAEYCDEVYSGYRDMDWLQEDQQWATNNAALLRNHEAVLGELATRKSRAAKIELVKLQQQNSKSCPAVMELIGVTDQRIQQVLARVSSVITRWNLPRTRILSSASDDSASSMSSNDMVKTPPDQPSATFASIYDPALEVPFDQDKVDQDPMSFYERAKTSGN